MKITYTKAAIAFIMIFGLAFLLASCARPLGACYENGYIGYGHTPKAIHGSHRTSF